MDEMDALLNGDGDGGGDVCDRCGTVDRGDEWVDRARIHLSKEFAVADVDALTNLLLGTVVEKVDDAHFSIFEVGEKLDAVVDLLKAQNESLKDIAYALRVLSEKA